MCRARVALFDVLCSPCRWRVLSVGASGHNTCHDMAWVLRAFHCQSYVLMTGR